MSLNRGQIRIRGSASVGLSGDPIIFIDGVRMNGERAEVARYSTQSRLNDIDPRDIESIELTIAFFVDPAGVRVELTEGFDKY